jgi:hypothetical protein
MTTKKADPIAPLSERLAPRQPVKTELRDAAREQPRRFLDWRDLNRPLGKRDRAEPARRPSAQGRGGGVELDLLAFDDAFAQQRLELCERDRSSEQDPALRGASGNLGDGGIGLARERRRLIDFAPRPLASRNAPPSPPRFLAMRSGKASARTQPAVTPTDEGPVRLSAAALARAVSAQRFAIARASSARRERSRRNSSSR